METTKKDLGMRRKDQDCGKLDANVTFQVLGIERTDPWGVCTNGEITEGSWSSNDLSHQSGCLEILKCYEDPSNMCCNVWSLISIVPCETFFCRTLTWSVTSLERSFSSSLLQSFVTFQVTPDLCIGKILPKPILEKILLCKVRLLWIKRSRVSFGKDAQLRGKQALAGGCQIILRLDYTSPSQSSLAIPWLWLWRSKPHPPWIPLISPSVFWHVIHFIIRIIYNI